MIITPSAICGFADKEDSMPARTHSGRGLSFLAAVLLSWTSGSVVQADVVLDGSLGSIGPLAGPDFMIDAVDGRTVGANL